MSKHNRDRRNEDPQARQYRLRNQRQCRTGQNPGSSWTILGSLKDLMGPSVARPCSRAESTRYGPMLAVWPSGIPTVPSFDPSSVNLDNAQT